ncbi:rRNA maturation RNase YbeY [Candidatus Nomurabacteria bacterium]|nr:MAG: rRNA maturation RNase YbeY [Candidatus Nomurabacteria bacterium]
MLRPDTISIINQTKGKLPRLPFANIKDKILGKKYELSIVFLEDKEIKKINKKYRGKNKPTNVLSFSLTENSGEILLAPDVIKKEAPKFGMNIKNFTGFLIIHGMLHLLGFDHGSTMEAKEEKWKKYFHIK